MQKDKQVIVDGLTFEPYLTREEIALQVKGLLRRLRATMKARRHIFYAS